MVDVIKALETLHDDVVETAVGIRDAVTLLDSSMELFLIKKVELEIELTSAKELVKVVEELSAPKGEAKHYEIPMKVAKQSVTTLKKAIKIINKTIREEHDEITENKKSVAELV